MLAPRSKPASASFLGNARGFLHCHGEARQGRPSSGGANVVGKRDMGEVSIRLCPLSAKAYLEMGVPPHVYLDKAFRMTMCGLCAPGSANVTNIRRERGTFP